MEFSYRLQSLYLAVDRLLRIEGKMSGLPAAGRHNTPRFIPRAGSRNMLG